MNQISNNKSNHESSFNIKLYSFFGRLQKCQNFQDFDTNSAKLKYIERPKYIELKYKMAKIQNAKM